jgi:hypothetical protein
LSRPASIQLGLNIRFTEFDVGWAAVHNGANAFAVGLTECGDAKNSAECAGHDEKVPFFSVAKASEKV